MHKPFYASGFLYHAPSRQILLQQVTRSGNTNLVLFCGKSHNGSNPQMVFRQCIEKALGRRIAASAIHEVYDYIDESLGEQFIFFIDASDVSLDAYPSIPNAVWFPLAKLAKYTMSEQTRHDIVVGERVIRALREPAHTSPQT